MENNKKSNRFGSALLSLAIAFGLWMFVDSNVSEVDDNTFYNIPIIIEGESKLGENNLMITGKSSETVSLLLSGSRSDLNKVDSSNITVKADVSQILEPGDHQIYPKISYPADVSNNAFTVENRTPSDIYISVDYRRTLEIPVKIKWTGTRSEDRIYDTENYMLDYSKITISGPAAVADKIASALLEIDLTGRTESISESFRYTLCDENDEPVDARQITTNVEEIRLDAQIHRIQELKLALNVNYGGGASSKNTTVKIEPATLRVSGGDAVLNQLGDSFIIGNVNLADMEKSHVDQTLTITLPEGVTNQTGVTEAKVSIRITGVTTKEFTVEQFTALNVPEGLEAEIINANLAVKVRGPAELMEKLEEEDIFVEVDFSSAEVGTATYKATIRFAEGFEAAGALKTYSVSATVQQKE